MKIELHRFEFFKLSVEKDGMETLHFLWEKYFQSLFIVIDIKNTNEIIV